MIDRFEEILRELGIEYGLPLHPDHRGACKLLINETMQLQIEYRQEHQALLALTFICEIPPGKFRENVLRTALKANHFSPTKSLLGYSDKNNQLALFQQIPLTLLTGKKLAELLTLFINKADEWRQRVQTGDLATLFSPTYSQGKGKGMFGL